MAQLRIKRGPWRSALLLLPLSLLSSHAHQALAEAPRPGAGQPAPFEPSLYRQMSQISVVERGGPHRFEVPAWLYEASEAEPLLADLRIMDPDSRPLPYLVREVWRPLPAGQVRPVSLKWEELPDGVTRALLDLGDGPGLLHDQLTLDLPEGNYLRRVKLESSPDSKLFTELLEDAPIFSISIGGPRTEEHRLRYPASTARYLRITVLPGADRLDLRFSSASVAVARMPVDLDLALGSTSLPLLEGTGKEDGVSMFSLGPLPPRCPITWLTLDIAPGAELVRSLKVDAADGAGRVTVGQAVIHQVRDGAGQTSRLLRRLDLQVDLARGRQRLRILSEDGDFPPLPLRGVSGRYLRQEVLFLARRGGPHVLLIGKKTDHPPIPLAPPASPPGAGWPRTVAVSPLDPNPMRADLGPIPRSRPWSHRHRLGIQIFVVGLLVLLVGWTAWLIRRGRGDPDR